MNPAPRSRRTLWLLSLGAAAGLALAAVGLLGSGSRRALGLPEGAVARVNDALIRSEDYARLVAGLENDRGAPPSSQLRRRVLDRMIDEELLVQRALELGLARADRRARANLVSAMIASVTAEAETQEPDADELVRFYAEERDFFTQPGRLHLRQVFLRVPRADDDAAVHERGAAAALRLRAGDPFAVVRAELGDREIAQIPDGLLPPQKLLEYLGPTALRAALELADGEVSDPVRSGTGYHVLMRVSGEPPRVPELADIEDLVRAEWTRRAGDRALRQYLDDLRDDAVIVE